MKYRCLRCGDVVDYRDAPIRLFSLVSFGCGILLGITLTLITIN